MALLRPGDGVTDGQLLESILSRRDEPAFEALLRRHGPMVLGVCRRVLHNEADAEDAFQATFLVFVRKAATIRPREMVGNWLYGVAYRTAMKARAMSAKRRTREAEAGRRVPRAEAPADGAWDELLEHLDTELSRLPDKYRVAVVLCELQGKSRKEAARLLGVPEGTLSWRLAQARKRLAQRLSRFGATLPGGALAALSGGGAPASMPPSLLTTMVRAGMQVAAGESLTAGAVPARVVVLAEMVVKTMLLTKLKAVVAVAFVLFVGAGFVGLSYRTGAAEPGDGPRALADELEALRLEVQSLRKSVDASRERIKALEAEVHASRERGAATPDNKTDGAYQRHDERFFFTFREVSKAPPDPLAEAEAALKALRDTHDPEAQRRAADALEKALERLKERGKPQGTTGNPQAK
jgi:RNA polymerase sigma factor (sigma-70 family)